MTRTVWALRPKMGLGRGKYSQTEFIFERAMSKKTNPGIAKKVGRSSLYSDAMADAICARMIEGESLVDICRDPDMPGRQTVYDWEEAHPEFRTRCARAREGLAEYQDHLIAELIAKCTPESAVADRVKLAGLQWRAAKLAPKRYGDRFVVDTAPATLSAEDDETFYAKLVEQAAKLGFDAGSAVRRLEDLRSKTIDGDVEDT